MISFEEYCRQLHCIRDGSLKNCRLVTSVSLSVEDSSLLFRTAVPSSIAQTGLCYLEFKIAYSHIYQEPLLLFRPWVSSQPKNADIEILSPWFPQDVARLLGIDDSFTISLDAIFSNSTHSQETWFSFHACDTAEIVGDRQEYKDQYLDRWLSIFLFSWLAKG